MNGLFINSGLSEEERERLHLNIHTENIVKLEFKEIRKTFINVPFRYGSQYIAHLKQYYGKKFNNIKVNIISEYGKELSTISGIKFWWEIMYENMIEEEVKNRINRQNTF